MSFKPRMQGMIDSYKGQPLPELMQAKENILAKRAELDRRLSAIGRAIKEIHRGRRK